MRSGLGIQNVAQYIPCRNVYTSNLVIPEQDIIQKRRQYVLTGIRVDAVIRLCMVDTDDAEQIDARVPIIQFYIGKWLAICVFGVVRRQRKRSCPKFIQLQFISNVICFIQKRNALHIEVIYSWDVWVRHLTTTCPSK